MKNRLYIRIAEGNRSYRADASFTSSHEPLSKPIWKNGHQTKEFLPTLHFAVDLNIPNEAFTSAGAVVGELNLELDKNLGISAEVSELENI